MATLFFSGSEHPRNSEVLDISEKSSVIISANRCRCGNCGARFGLKELSLSCPAQNCGVLWERILTTPSSPSDINSDLPLHSITMIERTFVYYGVQAHIGERSVKTAVIIGDWV